MNLNIQIEAVLTHLAVRNEFLNKTVFIFGMNSYAGTIVNALKKTGIFVRAILDNNENKCGKSFLDIPVAKPEDALIPFIEDSVFLIASKYYSEMKTQLEGMGYEEARHIKKLLDADMMISPDFVSGGLFLSQAESAKRGLIIYKGLLQKYGTVPIFLAPVSSVGDIFLLGLYFNKYIEKEGIENYVFCVPGRSGADMANTYDIRNIETITKSQADDLISFAMLTGKENADITILHSGYIHQRILCNIIMHENMTWLDNYKRFIFGFGEDEPFTRRRVARDTPKIEKLFHSLGLVKGKTVILSPYAQTISGLPEQFWKELSKCLGTYGYSVCTNVVGAEKPVTGTVPLSFSLDDADAVLEYAGFFIGLRSGLCDVVSMAECKKIILYSNEVFECIKVIDFYSLNKMKLCTDAIEIEVSYDEEKDINTVLSNFDEFKKGGL